MQIVEATDAGVRVVQLRLRRRGSPLQFLLFPMCHIGRPEFYQEVTRRLTEVDLIVAEGVGDSAAVDSLTAGYRTAIENGQLGLVLQNIDYDALGIPVPYPDFTGEQMDTRWATIPGWQRGILRAGMSSFVAGQRLIRPLVGSRFLEYQLRRSSMDDQLSLEELFSPAFFDHLDRVVVHERDDQLVAGLTDLHEQRHTEPITVAVVYGAEHMRAVVNRMGPLGYKVVSGEWLTVVEF